MSTISISSTINNRYQIQSILGQGGMATVYQALDTTNNTNVALKFLNPDQARVAKRKNRFLREFSILSKLKHEGIVKVFEQSESESGEPFFSMELIKGTTLDKKIKEAFATQTGASEIYTKESLLTLRELAKTLEYIHSSGIIFCDLKPANILVAENTSDSPIPQIKLIDFGIAINAEDPATEDTPNMIGTSYYMSPEQIRSEKLNNRSDIYSFGVVAFETLTGNVPFASDALFTVTASHLIGKVPLANAINHAVPSVIDRMIQICMEKKAESRYESMQEVVGRLESVTLASNKPSLLKRLGKFFKS